MDCSSPGENVFILLDQIQWERYYILMWITHELWHHDIMVPTHDQGLTKYFFYFANILGY